MNRNHRVPNPSNNHHRSLFSDDGDLFERAVARLEAGESISEIVASAPPDARDELSNHLRIVQAAIQIRQRPVPRSTATTRIAAKQNFLKAAAQMREQNARPGAPTRTKRTRSSTPRRSAGLLQQLAEAFQSLFGNRSLRLAPLVALIAVVVLSTSSLVTMAQQAVPGDLTYSFKQWIRQQELEFAPASQRAFVRQLQERELAEDVKKAAAKLDNNSAIIQAEDTQIYYGRNGRLLKVGGLVVMDRYQPDANREVFEQIDIDGDLQPGALVDLVYQIMPGQSDTVQGIALSVIAPPTEEVELNGDVPIAGETPTTEATQQAACATAAPEGWVLYEVKRGDNLTFLANRGGTTVKELMGVNCLESEVIWIGAPLYVPEQATDTSAPACAEVPEDWVEYEIQSGDTLTRLAESAGISVDEVMEANCLDSADNILIGSTLYLPQSSP